MVDVPADPIDLKIRQVFLSLDRDNDGWVTWADYQALVDRLLGAFRVDPDGADGRALACAYRSLWEEFSRHGGPRTAGCLSVSEFVRANRSLSVDSSRLDMLESVPGVIFDIIDRDGDDRISKADFGLFLRDVWGITAPEAMEVFTDVDSDADGMISRFEFLHGVREFFFSNDLSAAGSKYFGRLRSL